MFQPPPNPNMWNFQWRPPPASSHAVSPWRKPAFNRGRPLHGNDRNENLEHWCETCDRGFAALELLENHKKQHQKCNIDGCQFVAHPKVITRHIQMQHSSGLYKKIAKLDNPEEIKKWREERKNKYPTKSTIEKKNAEFKEKIDRGEKLGLKQDRRNYNNKKDYRVKRKNEFHNRNNQHDSKRRKDFTNSILNNESPNVIPKHMKRKPIPKVLPSMEAKSKLLPFAGMQNVVCNHFPEDDEQNLPANDLIDDEDFEQIVDTVDSTEMNIKPVCGALSSLMFEYGSSDDENNDQMNSNNVPAPFNSKKSEISNGENLIKTEEKVTTTITNLKSKPLINNNKSRDEPKSDDDSGPEEIKTTKIIENEENVLEANTRNNLDRPTKTICQKRQERNQLSRRPKIKVPSTLLTKLLQREMQQERNIILQCIRHIVRNNYFEGIKN